MNGKSESPLFERVTEEILPADLADEALETAAGATRIRRWTHPTTDPWGSC